MSKIITIYTSNTCGQCKMVKQVLNMKGHAYQEVNIDTEPHRHAEILQLTGQQLVPVTVIKDDQTGSQSVITGYNLSQLMPAIAA
jgi:glutaredoxin